jgi:hypothetical protein
MKRYVIGVLVGATLLLGVATTAQASTPGGTWTWCQNNGVLCIWAQQHFSGAGDYWSGSDADWTTGVGTNVNRNDDSFMNYSGLWVKVFNDINLGGGCEWHSSNGGYNEALGLFQNDDGQSHHRYSSNPGC